MALVLCADKIGTSYNNTKSAEYIKAYMEENSLVDIWRLKNPDKFKFMWKREAPTKALCRLNYFLISNGLIGCVEDVEILAGFRSDHSLVFLDIILEIYEQRQLEI